MNMLDNVISKQQEANALFLSSIEQGDFDKMCKALEMGADVNVQDSKNGNTGIMIAKEQLPFAKAFKIARYLVTEPNFNPSIENRDGISFIDMLDAELSKGNAAWQSISRKADMLNPDMSRNRKNTPIKQQIKQLQNEYNRFIQSYGEEMRQVLGYEAKIESSDDSFYSGQLRSCDEEGTSYVDYLSWDARYNTDHGFVVSDRPLTVLDALHLERKDGSWEEIPLFLTNLEDKYDPKRLDIKMLAQDFTDIENQQNSNNTTNIVAQGGFNHASTDAETYMFVRGRRGSYSLVKIQTHTQADKVK